MKIYVVSDFQNHFEIDVLEAEEHNTQYWLNRRVEGFAYCSRIKKDDPRISFSIVEAMEKYLSMMKKEFVTKEKRLRDLDKRIKEAEKEKRRQERIANENS